MMDAILFTVRDGIRTDLGYDARTCEIMDSGQPPPRCGDVFLAVHPAGSRNDMIGALNEYLAFSVTLTMRVVVPTTASATSCWPASWPRRSASTPAPIRSPSTSTPTGS